MLPRIQALQTQLSASCVRPSSRRSPPKQLGQQLSSYYTPVQGPQCPEEQTERLAEPLWGFGFLQLLGKASSGREGWWFSPAAPASASAPETAAPNGPQLVPGSREKARRGHGPVHCAAGVPSHEPRARLASRSLGQATPDSRSSLPGRRNQRRAAALRGFGCTTRAASGRREAVPSFATVSSSPAQHPRTPHALCLLTGRSPES